MYITRARVLGVYHWMYASHVVSSWGRTSLTKFWNVVAQRSTYGCNLPTQEKVPGTPLATTYDELNIFISI
jgi:hypothetical protein